MWTRCNSTIFLLLLSCPLILIFLSACSKGPSEEDCPRYTVMTKKGVEVKLEPGAEAKLTGARAFVTGAIGYTEKKKLADTDRVLLRLDAYQHRYCILAFKAEQNAKKAKTEEESQKYLAEKEKMLDKSLGAFDDLKTLALKYDEVMKGEATTVEFTDAVNKLKAEIVKLGEEIKEDKVLQKEFKKIDEKIVPHFDSSDSYSYPDKYSKEGEIKKVVTKWDNGKKHEDYTLVNGKKNGGYISWHESGNMAAKGSYQYGKQEGIWTNWYDRDDGRKQFEGAYVDGIVEGKWIYWHANGRKYREGVYKNGMWHGEFVEWHASGNMADKGSHKYNKREGTWTNWYDNERKQSEGAYLNGKLEGKWIYWDEDGRKKEERNYKEGQQLERSTYKMNPDGSFSVTKFDKDGKKISETTLSEKRKGPSLLMA